MRVSLLLLTNAVVDFRHRDFPAELSTLDFSRFRVPMHDKSDHHRPLPWSRNVLLLEPGMRHDVSKTRLTLNRAAYSYMGVVSLYLLFACTTAFFGGKIGTNCDE